MISIASQARAIANHDADFTIEHYRQLLRLARRSWPLVGYNTIPFGQRFLLWRHDCDYSLNRALALARVEQEEGVHATYFVNPHCEFYHLLERSQLDIVRELRSLGHDVALHFDGMFHTSRDEAELARQLEREASLLEDVLGVRPTAFSFHNPTAFHLSCEEEIYAGMVNCYSHRIKREVAYCSDSNGYWRFRRLHDVLEQAQDASLQVLTHPGWWQDEPMTPRQRVFRSVYGRAEATVRFFDEAIEAGGRENPGGARREITFLRASGHHNYELLDHLYHHRQYAEMQMSLWRLLCQQVRNLCDAELLATGVDTASLQHLHAPGFGKLGGLVPWTLFETVFEHDWESASQLSMERSKQLYQQTAALLVGAGEADGDTCLELLQAIDTLARFGKMHALNFDGLSSPPTDCSFASHSDRVRDWQHLLERCS